MRNDNLVSTAELARGDLALMLAVCEVVCISTKATSLQVEAATNTRRSIVSAINGATKLKVQVANARFEKLVALL
ncbi:hypothetical protein AXW83_14870 [Bosea sp. PAMC 26642]|nr:hypothetical protein AXW83_14870 [Bosea sp. PAMC 26642]